MKIRIVNNHETISPKYYAADSGGKFLYSLIIF